MRTIFTGDQNKSSKETFVVVCLLLSFFLFCTFETITFTLKTTPPHRLSLFLCIRSRVVYCMHRCRPRVDWLLTPLTLALFPVLSALSTPVHVPPCQFPGSPASDHTQRTWTNLTNSQNLKLKLP